MSDVSERVVLEVRDWIGTPYLHQASVKGVGTDCLGLLRGVWRSLCGQEPEAIPFYTADWCETSPTDLLGDALDRNFQRRPDGSEAVGDVLLFRMKAGCPAKHVGLQTRVGTFSTFVHAFSRRAVVESPLSAPWRRKIVARFAFPEEVVSWQQ